MRKVKQIKYIDNTDLCLLRKKYGNGYQYYNETGDKITDKKVLSRLKKLVIPPMWDKVMICKWPDGHIQATGRDLKGRKQYIYHSEWERQRQAEKFARMKSFGKVLPIVRKKCLSDLKAKNWHKSKVLALMLLILDETGIRIGNQQYVKKNETYGLTTLRRRHLDIDQSGLTFEYKGKSNKNRSVAIDDNDLVKFIRKSAELPGYEIFRYRDKNGDWLNVDSDEVNDYIKESMGDEFSSKDFRTWVASRLAVEYYPQALNQKENAPRKKFTNILIRLVADELGNTPSVCKNYYVHPNILQLIDKKELPVYEDYTVGKYDYSLSAAEKIVLEVI